MPTAIGSYSLMWILLGSMLDITESSHFGGATVSWKHGRSFEEAEEVVLDIRIAWRRSNSPNTNCDQDDIDAGKDLSHGDSENYEWVCTSGCNGTVTTSDVICSEFDEQDDWSVGFRTAYFNVSSAGIYNIEFSGCCWIKSLVYTGSNWRLPIHIDLRTRSDTGESNSSPVTAAMPVVKFQAGCPDHVDLVLHDADGDYVSCEYFALDECKNDVCNTYPYLRVTQHGDKCRISYNAGGPGDTHVVISIKLEDYPLEPDKLYIGADRYTNSTPLSSITFQFLVTVFDDRIACDLKPTWIEPTFPNGFKTSAIVGEIFTVLLKLSSEIPIARVNVIGPLGVGKSAITKEGNEYNLSLHWVPTNTRSGPNIICVAAKDDNTKMSEQRCMVVNVAVASSPCDVKNGGCSDSCIVSGTSYFCECARDCWKLAEDRRTCIPNVFVDCGNNGFSVLLDECAVSATDIIVGFALTSPIVRTTDCQVDNNDTHYSANIPYDACGTLQDTDFLEIHYRNQLKVWLDDQVTLESSGEEKHVITRGYYYKIEMVCSFNKYGIVNGTFIPQDQGEQKVSIPGLGSFQFFFDFYMDENFQFAYSPYEYPITVTVNSDIYFGIRSVGASGLEVFTEKCVAMTTQTPTVDTLSYTMIDNGCGIDSTLRKYDKLIDMEERFAVKAFTFQELIASSNVNIYIQCSAVLCVLGPPSTRCQKGCISTRKRRDAGNVEYLDHQIRTRRRKRETEEASPTFAPNVTESQVLQITVSGPFRIEVIPASPGVPAVTVATPTRTPATPSSKKTTTTTTEKVLQDTPPSDSWRIIIIACSVAGILFLILLILVIVIVAYHYLVLKPKQRILPNEDQKPASAWTTHSAATTDDHEYCRAPINRSPPPSFWDLQPLT